MFRDWIERRRRRDEDRIVGALWRETALSGFSLVYRTGLSGMRVYDALDRLVEDGVVKRGAAGQPIRVWYELYGRAQGSPPARAVAASGCSCPGVCPRHRRYRSFS